MSDIVLVMIVKNESKIIERCLNSTKDIISSFSIIDTGSTDNTFEIITNWSLQNNIKGQILQRPWKNFGHNRTESFIEAKKYIIDHNFDKSKTFALFIDADMILHKLPKFNKHHLLKYKGLDLKQTHNSLFYYNLRLASFDCDWKCIGVTHEYWDSPGVSKSSYDFLEIDDKEDGGSKSDKFQRDEILLTQGLVDEPKNTRYMFYLAQTYWCLGNYDKSIHWYKKRVEFGGWYEETWYSHYKIVENYIKLNKPLEAIEWCLKGYHYYPKRTESFNILCKHLRDTGNYNLCYFLSNFVENIQLPHDKLFIEKDVYEYKFTEHKSISSFYCNKIDDGYESCEKLLKLPTFPNKTLILNNSFYYIQSIPHSIIQNINLLSPISFLSDKNDIISIISDTLYINNSPIFTHSHLLNSTSIFPLDKLNIIINFNNNTHITLLLSSPQFISKHSNIFPINTYTPKKELISKSHLFSDNLHIINHNDIELCTSLFSNLYNTFPQTNAIDFNKGHLFVLQVRLPEQNKYYSRFLWTSHNYTYKKFSKMFFIKEKGSDEILFLSKKSDHVLSILKNKKTNKLYVITIPDSEIEKHLIYQLSI